MFRQTAIAILMLASCVAAQPTYDLHGVVLLENGNPAQGATVRLDCHQRLIHYEVQTALDGTFDWFGLDSTWYDVSVMMPEQGFASWVGVIPDELPNPLIVILTCPDTASPDLLTEVWLEGTTLVEAANEEHSLPWYFLDVNDDQHADYRMCFGPPWYDAQFADRPSNGSVITIIAGLFSYCQPPMVIVNYVNFDLWRLQGEGHGGYGGTQGFLSLVCHSVDTSGTAGLPNPRRIELKGIAMFDLCGPDTTTPYGVFDFAAIPDDPLIDYHLNFGMNRQIPFNMFDSLFVVGGLVEVAENEAPWVIVYEVNGEFWREPGDTSGLAPMGQAADPPFILRPSFFSLSAFPNPFNAATTLSFTLPKAELITLRVYDLLGRVVDTISSGRWEAGEHHMSYSAGHLSSGIYFARLETSTTAVTQKLVILK